MGALGALLDRDLLIPKKAPLRCGATQKATCNRRLEKALAEPY
jgi:hypothetical protein